MELDPEVEEVFCRRLVDDELLTEAAAIESRDELLNDRSALVRTRGALPSADSDNSGFSDS